MTWNLRRLRVGSRVVAGSLVLVLGSGFLFQFLATERERRAFPPVGRLVDAGGYRLHLYCLGTGSPAVVFESGFGMSLNAWALVQPAVADIDTRMLVRSAGLWVERQTFRSQDGQSCGRGSAPCSRKCWHSRTIPSRRPFDGRRAGSAVCQSLSNGSSGLGHRRVRTRGLADPEPVCAS